jgi:hypothetical protein
MRLLLIMFVVVGCAGPAVFVETTGDGDGLVRSDPDGIECGDTCGMLASGTVTLTAVVETGTEFAGWDGACTGAETTCTVDVAEDVHVGARFVLIPHMLEVTHTKGGSVSSMPFGIECGEDCSESFAHGTRVTLVPHAADGYTFRRWTNLECADSETCVLDLVEPRTLEAEFIAHQLLTVTTAGEGHGIVRLSPQVTTAPSMTAAYPFGSEVTLTAIPDPGSQLVGWTGECVALGDTCRVTMDRPRSLVATFRKTAGAMCNSYVTANEPSMVFNTRLAFGATVCLAPGVVITGAVTIPSNAWGVRILGVPGAPVPRIVGYGGPAISAAQTRDLVIEHVDLEASGPNGTAVVLIEGGAGYTIKDVTLRATCNGCALLSTKGGATVKVQESRLLAYESAPSSARVLDAADSEVEISDSFLAAPANVIYATAGIVSVVRSTVESHATQTGAAISVSNATLTVRESVVRVLGHDVIQTGMFDGEVSLTLDDNEFRKIAGATAGSVAPFNMLRGVNHVYSMQANTFCNEGVATTDGEFAPPWITGPTASDSTFASVAHIGPMNCP